MIVTAHACERFCERVRPCSFDEARDAVLSHARAIEKAIAFGCEVVRLGDGCRIILQGDRVVTVLRRDQRPEQICNPYRMPAQ